jgi:isoaspartyl peptidase/L-asparaginase-like protein (Ntn-hydrolase superfamily)
MDVIVHGGAGAEPHDPAARDRGLSRAVDAARMEASPTDAVEAAVRVLEADPVFNAGVGGAIQADGVVRTDAGVMTGAVGGAGSPAPGLRSGAACSMRGVPHAISVARLVRAETPHVLLSGPGAVNLAAAFGVETDVDLTTDRTRSRWADADSPDGDIRERLTWVRDRFGGQGGAERDHDTVGAVAFDGDRFATATSTGGRWFAVPGRVGDVPQVGGGFYASETGAASATGHGEEIAEDGLARRVVSLIGDGHDAATAAATAIERFAANTAATAGVIAIDGRGRVGSAHNAAAMGVSTWSP